MSMSTNTFATAGSFASTALPKSVASISICTWPAEKYSRRCVSMSETNVQKASSSGDCSSRCPAMTVKPRQVEY